MLIIWSFFSEISNKVSQQPEIMIIFMVNKIISLVFPVTKSARKQSESRHSVSFRGVTRCLIINGSEDTKNGLNY